MARKTLSERRFEKMEELDRIKLELARLESQAAERIGRLAIKVGLADLDIEEDHLAKEFAAIVATFQSRSGQKTKPASPDAD